MFKKVIDFQGEKGWRACADAFFTKRMLRKCFGGEGEVSPRRKRYADAGSDALPHCRIISRCAPSGKRERQCRRNALRISPVKFAAERQEREKGERNMHRSSAGEEKTACDQSERAMPCGVFAKLFGRGRPLHRQRCRAFSVVRTLLFAAAKRESACLFAEGEALLFLTRLASGADSPMRWDAASSAWPTPAGFATVRLWSVARNSDAESQSREGMNGAPRSDSRRRYAWWARPTFFFPYARSEGVFTYLPARSRAFFSFARMRAHSFAEDGQILMRERRPCTAMLCVVMEGPPMM